VLFNITNVIILSPHVFVNTFLQLFYIFLLPVMPSP